MGSAGGPVGPRGLALLAVTAVAGVALAVHGWSARHGGLPVALPGARPAPSASGARPASPAAGASPSPGPLLSSQPYAAYSYPVWPGSLSAEARLALTGLSVSVRRDGGGISVQAGVAGQPPGAARLYPEGARVYVVEASLGDDSGNSDYNLGDDALVVTDAQQRIVP